MKSKAIVLIALTIMAATLLFAPYDFVGHVGITEPERVSGTTYRRVGWTLNQPVHLDYLNVDQYREEKSVFIEATELDTGQLGLWWFGLALVTGAALVLARRDRKSDN